MGKITATYLYDVLWGYFKLQFNATSLFSILLFLLLVVEL